MQKRKIFNLSNIIPFVNQSLTVQSTHPQHLNFCVFNLLLPITRFGHYFDHHRVEKCEHNNEKCAIEEAFPQNQSTKIR
jgi:hypothetical protein